MGERETNIEQETAEFKALLPSLDTWHRSLKEVVLRECVGLQLPTAEKFEVRITRIAADALLVLDEVAGRLGEVDLIVCGATSLDALSASVEDKLPDVVNQWKEQIVADCNDPEFPVRPKNVRNRLLSFAQGVPTSTDRDLPLDSYLMLAVQAESEIGLSSPEKPRPASLDVLASVFKGPKLRGIIGSVRSFRELDGALRGNYSSAQILDIKGKAHTRLESMKEQTTGNHKVVDRAIRWVLKDMQVLMEAVGREKEAQKPTPKPRRKGVNGEPFSRISAGGRKAGPGSHSRQE